MSKLHARDFAVRNYFTVDWGSKQGQFLEVNSYGRGRYNRIDIGVVFSDGSQDSLPPSELSPIPITPEILEKAGFVYVSIIFKYSHKSEIFEVSVNGGEVYFRHNEYEITKMNYLHQLQNLFYSITGTELEINL